MNILGDITSLVELEEHCGLQQPKYPWNFAKDIQDSQEYNLGVSSHTVLFNKGRYFETSFHNKDVCNEVSTLIDSPIKHNRMIVDSWRKLEDFVIAMNCLGIYVIINTDWV